MKKLAHDLAGKASKPVLYFVLSLAFAACAPLPEGPEGGEIQGAQIDTVFPPPPAEARFYLERVLRSSADVVQEEEESSFKRAITGEARRGEGLGKPYSVAVFQGRVFVGDTAAHSIKVFDLPGRRFYKIGEGGGDDDREGLQLPLGLDVDRVGNLYVCDGNAKVVKVYTKDGKFLRKLGGAEWFSRPSSVAVDPDGTRIYVVDIGGTSSNEHRIRVFDAHSGQHLLDIGKRGSGEGELNLPRDAQVSAKDGLLYVVDSGNFRVEVFTRDGKFVRAFGQLGLQMGNFSRPKEIAIDPSGNVYVVDAGFGNAQIFNPEGQLLLPLGSRGPGDRPGHYMLPSGVAVDEDGRVYIADQYFRRVDVYRPASLKVDQGFAVLGGQKAVAK
jgi:DNA-binding beta-propeller fold protein YncE